MSLTHEAGNPIERALSTLEPHGGPDYSHGFRQGVEAAKVNAMIAHGSVVRDLEVRIERLKLALNAAIRVADECAGLWDDDTEPGNDVRLGKVLLGLAGHNKKYRADLDLIHDVIGGENASNKK